MTDPASEPRKMTRFMDDIGLKMTWPMRPSRLKRVLRFLLHGPQPRIAPAPPDDIVPRCPKCGKPAGYAAFAGRRRFWIIPPKPSYTFMAPCAMDVYLLGNPKETVYSCEMARWTLGQ